jgi:hypothetical protein
MGHTSTVSIKAARCLMAAIAAVNVIRAMTLPVTVGEAWNYDRFVAPPWREALEHFDVNNHVLNTLLVRISTARFHLTELSLRLPSLMGGILLLWAVYRLARRFGSGPMFLCVAGLVTLNPMTMDAMSEARGYGMALAALLWGLEWMLESAEWFNGAKFKLAAVCLGLSIAASLAFAAPALALLMLYLGWGRGWIWPQGQGRVFALIALLTAFVFLAVPIDHVDATSFLSGATSLRQTLNEMSAVTFGSSSPVVFAASRIGMAVVAGLGAVWTLLLWRHRWSGLTVLSGGTVSLSLLILLAAHRRWNATFPQGGALYLIPLSTLLVAALFLRWNRKAAQIAFYAVSFGLMLRYVSEINFRTYSAGDEFAGGRTLAKTLRAEVGTRAVSVGVSEAAEPVFNYYRARLRQGNWERAEHKALTGNHDYYVLAGADRALVEQRHLLVLYQDSGLILAR